MKKIRIGKDILFDWSITTNGKLLPLINRDLKLELILPTGKRRTIDFTTSENVITFILDGKDQKITGVYGLTLWENFGKIGQSVVDITRAFELVSTTEEELY